jgi:hypothetical protein
MPQEVERDFHIRRAREELDLAYRADAFAVAAVHLKLSALHMARLRPASAAAAAAGGAPPSFRAT